LDQFNGATSEAAYQKVGLWRTASATLVELVLKEITDRLERGETVKLHPSIR
jgi:integration host factor subunit alpha